MATRFATEAFLKRLGEHAGEEFFVSDTGRCTYADLLQEVNRARALLAEAGVQAGDFVLLKGDFNPRALGTLLALASWGATFAPLTEVAAEKLAPQLPLLRPNWLLDLNAGDGRPRRLSSEPSRLRPLFPEGEPGLIVFTSGSTGTPKGIVHAFDPLLEKFEKKRFPHRAIPFLLFDHMGGVNTALSLASSGGCIIQPSGRGVAEICAAIEKYRVTLLPTTPTFLNMLLVSGEYKKRDLSSLKVITYGTEMMTEAVLRKLVETFPGVSFKQTYGLSEVGVLATTSRSNDTTWVKVGGEGVETKIEDDILWIRARSRMLGHFEFPPGAEPGWVPQSTEWFCTGDNVEQDGEWLKFKGRHSDLINISGLKVYPSEIENCLLQSALVKDVAVVGEANLLTGKIVAAYVVLASGDTDKKSAREQLDRHCRERLDRFKIPAKFAFVDSLAVSDRFKKVKPRGN